MEKNPAEILAERRTIWKSKEVITKLYHKWYCVIADAMRPGTTLELGGGSGNLKEFFPNAITSDVVFAPWLDAVLDAHRLPFKDESLSSIVLFDVLHHLMKPSLFFSEAERVLKPKGRIIMMEPYISWSSYLVYRFLHAEGMNWHVDPFELDKPSIDKNPFHGNQAIPTLMFEKYSEKFNKNFPRLKILREEKMDSIVYPLSGGFHNPSLAPVFLWGAFEFLERSLKTLRNYLAFRLFMVLEKT